MGYKTFRRFTSNEKFVTVFAESNIKKFDVKLSQRGLRRVFQLPKEYVRGEDILDDVLAHIKVEKSTFARGMQKVGFSIRFTLTKCKIRMIDASKGGALRWISLSEFGKGMEGAVTTNVVQVGHNHPHPDIKDGDKFIE